MNAGDVLYRDVYFGVTPLSLYIAAILTRLFGTDILVVKIAGALVSTATMYVCVRIAREAAAGRRDLLALAILVFASPATMLYPSFYSALATLFAVISLWLVVSWARRCEHRLLIAAGCSAGLCFLSKQNIGAYAALALAFSIASVAQYERRGARWALERIGSAAIPAATVVLLGLLPVVASGGLPELINYGFLGKGVYLDLGAVSYFAAFQDFLDAAAPLSSETMRALRTLIPFLFAPALVALIAMAAPAMSGHLRSQSRMVIAFTIASLVGIYPRADTYHLVFAVPFLLLAVAIVWPAAASRIRFARLIHTAAYALLGVAALTVVGDAARRAASRANIPSPFPHFRGSLIDSAESRRLQKNLEILTGFSRDGRTFVISPNASFYYLAGNIRNPSPFDYPFATTFGRSGQQATIDLIRRKRIARVCIDLLVPPIMRPRTLEEFVRSQLRRIDADAFCELYSAE